MKFYIPKLGDKIILKQNWIFSIKEESRNRKFIDSYFGKNIVKYYSTTPEIVFPQGTILKIDRIYIRHGAPAFDSITFRVISFPEDMVPCIKGKPRFFASLEYVNQIEFEKYEC